jgi:hypothetical protein
MNLFDTLLIAVSVSLLVLAVWWARRRGHLQGDQAATAQAAISACNTLLKLIACIQQHRGMSTAWLAGDPSFERRLAGKRGEIEPLIVQLQQLAAIENGRSYPCFTPNDVTLWRHRWSMLVNELSAYTVEKSIASHSNLVAILLNWLDAIGEARIELPMGDLLPEGAVRNFAHRLPQLTETLGQARATGSGVAALGACPAVARVRLMFLISRAESLVDQACAVDAKGGLTARQVKALALTIRTEMLSKDKVNIGAEAFFTEATRAIDAVFLWVEECGQALEANIAKAAEGRAQTGK